ncbi:MAG: hypothetical protein KC766_25865 [Myxococcales bacterium]|nr:hypothetical protein [Myxococcales bacterium]
MSLAVRLGAASFLTVMLVGNLALAQPLEPETAQSTGGDHGQTYLLPPEPEVTPPRDTDRLGWYVPDFAKVQTGGLRGRYTAGLGYAAFDDVLNVGLLYGYSPNAVNDSGVSTLSLELSARPFEIRAGMIRIIPLEVGIGALYAPGSEFELSYPDRYASGYYPPTALHTLGYLGVEVDWVPASGFFERIGLYYQASTIYTYLEDLVQNADTARPTESIASTLGYRAAF